MLSKLNFYSEFLSTVIITHISGQLTEYRGLQISFLNVLTSLVLYSSVFQTFWSATPFALNHFKGPTEEWVCVKKHPGVDLI